MKKIIFFSYDMNIGGMEKALLLLLNHLVNEYDVSLVLEKKSGVLLEQLDKRIHVSEYRNSDCKIVLLRKILNFSQRIWWYKKNYGKYDFSCSYATYSVIGSRLALAASENNALYVHSNYYDYYKGNASKICNFFELLSVEKFKNILFVSNESKDKLKAVLPEIENKGKVINNLVDYKNIKELAEEENVDRTTVEGSLFLFVGRLEEESKRLSRLLEAFALAYSQNKKIELWIVGDGKDYSLCKRLIEKYKLQNSVKLLGKKLNPYPYMKAADCMILTSDFEGYPVIYNECMVLQKPIITTIPVSDQYFDIKDYAILVEKDSNQIAKKIKEFHKYSCKKINFEEINNGRIESLKEIINGK